MSRHSYLLDSPDLSGASGSRLLSMDTPMLTSEHSYSRGQQGDLSLADLSLADDTVILNKPFSLLARPDDQPEEPSTPERRSIDLEEEYEEEESRQVDAVEGNAEDLEVQRTVSESKKEEKLRSDLFVLKKLNAAFELFDAALQDTEKATGHISEQLKQTDALLNKYTEILSRSEDFAQFIFDERFEGVDADRAEITRLVKEKRDEEERRKKEAARRAQEERERQEREEAERRHREEQARLDLEKPTKTALRGSVRGVRGTRASMRGSRGAAPSSRPAETASSSASASASLATRGTARRTSAIPTRARGIPRP